MDVPAAIVFAGTANAAILSAVSAANRRRHPAASWLCLLLALLSVAVAAIIIQHRLEGVGERLAVTFEHLAAYASAPVVYFYVRAAVGAPAGAAPQLLHFVPAGVFLLAGAPLLLTGSVEPPPFPITIGYMIAYTAASLVVFARAWKGHGFSASLAWPSAILGTMVAIHSGQMVRLTSDSPALQDVVAIAGALAVFGLLGLALAGFLPWAFSTVSRYRRSPVSEEELAESFAALDTALETQELYRRPGLRLNDLAAATGLSPHRASQALSQAGGVSFHELVAHHRVAEACRLLSRPDNAGVSVEPIGMMAGFRSRSSFYDAFQKRMGMTPVQYRDRRSRDNSCPAPPERTAKS